LLQGVAVLASTLLAPQPCYQAVDVAQLLILSQTRQRQQQTQQQQQLDVAETRSVVVRCSLCLHESSAGEASKQQG
jgi:hypothetical protein